MATETTAMLVSIVIINYNYGRYLTRAIDSALNQTYPHVEVVVVDDGSLDNSVAIINGYAGRITPILKENSGHCSCINLGFEKCHGDVVLFLDADDVLHDFAVVEHARNLRNPDVVKSCGYLEVIDAAGKPTGQRIPRALSPSGDYRELTLAKGLGMYRSSYTSGNAWSRRFLDQVMPLPDKRTIDNRIGPDGYLTSVDVLFGRIESIHRPIGQYRIHGKNNGPVSFRFDPDYMRMRLQCRYERIDYAERIAQRLGLQVNTREFRRVNDWRLNLMQHLLESSAAQGGSHDYLEFVVAPFRQYRLRLRNAAVLSMIFFLIRVLPPTPSLRLARFLLVRRSDRGY